MAPPYGKKFPYISGNCGNGWHEGTKPRSHKGQALPVCVAEEFRNGNNGMISCQCKCHKALDEMFKMTGQERVPVPNPDYEPPPRARFIMPTREEIILSRASTPTGTARLESRAPGLPADMVRPSAPTATPTGKRPPGQLETQVKEACDFWLVGDIEGVGEGNLLTMKAIADYIGPDDDGKLASVGAIQAVLERWVKYGFASMGTKPVRFTGYTVAGMTEGLDSLRHKWQEQNKRKVA